MECYSKICDNCGKPYKECEHAKWSRTYCPECKEQFKEDFKKLVEHVEHQDPSKLKLYVWEGIYCDYTCGMGFAIADSLEKAVILVELSQTHKEDYIKGKYPFKYNPKTIEGESPKIYDLNSPIAFSVYGGG